MVSRLPPRLTGHYAECLWFDEFERIVRFESSLGSVIGFFLDVDDEEFDSPYLGVLLDETTSDMVVSRELLISILLFNPKSCFLFDLGASVDGDVEMQPWTSRRLPMGLEWMSGLI